MSKEVKGKRKVAVSDTYETLKALYYSGKVKPSLNKMIAKLENDSENIELVLLACQCLERTKDIDKLSFYAELSIKDKTSKKISEFYQESVLNLNEISVPEELKKSLTLLSDYLMIREN